MPTKSDLEAAHRVSLEANLSTEVGIIVLDLIGVYMNKFKEKLEDNGGDNTKVTSKNDGWLGRGGGGRKIDYGEEYGMEEAGSWNKR